MEKSVGYRHSEKCEVKVKQTKRITHQTYRDRKKDNLMQRNAQNKNNNENNKNNNSNNKKSNNNK